MDLVTPGVGLVFWTTLTFIILLVILGKFAWPVITKAIAKREAYIADAIKKADEVNIQIEKIKEERRAILAEAKEEQNMILKEVNALKEKLIQEAKDQAQAEATKMIENAKASILQEQEKALKGIKNQVAMISIDIAEKVLRKNLSQEKAQTDYINTLMEDISVLNN